MDGMVTSDTNICTTLNSHSFIFSRVIENSVHILIGSSLQSASYFNSIMLESSQTVTGEVNIYLIYFYNFLFAVSVKADAAKKDRYSMQLLPYHTRENVTFSYKL